MKNILKRTWCEINLNNLHYNINLLKNKSQKQIMAVVKANAYGHGDKYIANELESTGIKMFAVSNAHEAISLRNFGVQSDILILGYTSAESLSDLIENNISQTIYSVELAQKFIPELQKLNKKLKIHIKIDTGMHRLGFNNAEEEKTILNIVNAVDNEYFEIDGIFTHFSHADSPAKDALEFTRNQMDTFDKIILALEEKGLSFKNIHAQNSAGIISCDNYLYNCVRAGILMYGLKPAPDLDCGMAFKPIMELKSIVSQVKFLKAGDFVSYGRTFKAPTDMKIATIPVGYADGYRRSFGEKGEVLIRGERCKIIGVICMDQMIVDVTNLVNVNMGDEVILVGKYGNESITFDDLALMDNTINYELVCGISRRVPRLYIKDYKIIGVDIT